LSRLWQQFIAGDAGQATRFAELAQRAANTAALAALVLLPVSFVAALQSGMPLPRARAPAGEREGGGAVAGGELRHAGLSSRGGRRSMPHVRRSMLITVDADTERVRRALVDDLALAPTAAGFAGPIDGMPDTTAGLEAVVLSSTSPTTDVRLDAVSDVTWCALRGSSASRPGWKRALPPPRPPPSRAGQRRRSRRSSRSRRSHRCRSRRAGGPARRPGAVALLANFCGSLLSQNGDAVTSAFDQSDQALGVALAVCALACWCRCGHRWRTGGAEGG
jgi:hypothetical protein